MYNIYFPDGAGSAEKLEYKLFYNKFLKSIENKSKVIICGDFNIAHQPSDIHKSSTAKRYVGFLKKKEKKLTI
ncbi:hypothetical protein [Methanobacterium alcaliphilum]|uniref:hypothetical protein n=1 Tax=Methanobacterium alcaliphilum TaxID=392018 RepID=UPI00200A920E|nr:hypothetical protein [Methanobacterium alcaliphilum]MCK9151663.1 hypothetical protein [Methanobacterium alcaliphilum]